MLLCSLNIIRQSEFLVGLKEATCGGGVIWAVTSGSFIFWLLLCAAVLAKQFPHQFHLCSLGHWCQLCPLSCYKVFEVQNDCQPNHTVGVRGLHLSPARRSHLILSRSMGTPHPASQQWVSCCPLMPGQESWEWIAENSGNGQGHFCPGCKQWLQKRICSVEL